MHVFAIGVATLCLSLTCGRGFDRPWPPVDASPSLSSPPSVDRPAVLCAREGIWPKPHLKHFKKPVSHLPDHLPEPERSFDDSGQGSGQLPTPSGAEATEIRDALATR